MKLLSGLSEIRLDNIQSCTMLYSDLNVFFSKSMAFVEASLLYFNKYVISVKSICRIKKNQFFEMLEKNNIRTIYWVRLRVYQNYTGIKKYLSSTDKQTQ